MGYENDPRGGDRQRDAYGRWDRDDGQHGDYGRDARSGEYGHQRYGQREQMSRGLDYGRGGGDRERYEGGGGGGGDYYGGARDAGRGGFGAQGYGERHPNDRGYGQRAYAERARPGYGARDEGGRGYGGQPQGYSYEDRGFLARAGDEVRSWFGDDEAERRRDRDARLDERYANDRDDDYHSWRRGQIDALDRDYHEYRQENRSRFENEFSTWRTARQGQRDQLKSVAEHQEVVGSDGAHVGIVDKVRGDRILLTRNDKDAGGHHHSIPSRWIDKVADKVTLSKTAAEAKQAWQDEESRQALSGWGDRPDADRERGGTDLNRSFSGTY